MACSSDADKRPSTATFKYRPVSPEEQASTLNCRPGVPNSSFFEGLSCASAASTGMSEAPSAAYFSDFLATDDGLSLTKAFMQIKNPKLRRRIVTLVEEIADEKKKFRYCADWLLGAPVAKGEAKGSAAASSLVQAVLRGTVFGPCLSRKSFVTARRGSFLSISARPILAGSTLLRVLTCEGCWAAR